MILHRLASAIRHQNWSQIITEILIVVIGIFLGLQVSDWNEGRKNDIAEAVYIDQLLIDTRLALEISEARTERTAININSIGELLKVLKGKSLNEDNFEEFEAGLRRIALLALPEMGIGYVGDVMDGQIPSKINDANIIRAAIELERRINLAFGRIDQLLSQLNISSATVEKYYGQGMTSIEGLTLIYDFEVLKSSPEFTYAVQNALVTHNRVRGESSRIRDALAEFLLVLEQAVEE